MLEDPGSLLSSRDNYHVAMAVNVPQVPQLLLAVAHKLPRKMT